MSIWNGSPQRELTTNPLSGKLGADQTALADPHYTVTEVLAGAPQLIARYEQASEEQRAVLNAAIDSRRLGIQAPLTETLLQAAARGYLSTLHPDDTWLSPALDELTRHDRATAPLIEVFNEEKSARLGYTVADYLLQRASRERRYERVPPSTWDAMISHIRDPADAARLANSAKSRLLFCYAIPLYRHAADAGEKWAADSLAGLLADRGALDELRARADAGDEAAAMRLARLLADRGDPDEAAQMLDAATQILRARTDAGDQAAAYDLASLLADRGALDELRTRADAGDGPAALRLAHLLADRGDPDEAAQMLDAATQILRARTDAGDTAAALSLAHLLADRGDLDGAAQILRARTDAGDAAAALNLGNLAAAVWRARGDPDEAAQMLDAATQILRAQADAGDQAAAYDLAYLLVRHGVLDELRARVDAGDAKAAWWLADLLAGHGYLAGLGERGRRRAAGPGGTARPGRRRRPGCRLPAGRAAGRAR